MESESTEHGAVNQPPLPDKYPSSAFEYGSALSFLSRGPTSTATSGDLLGDAWQQPGSSDLFLSTGQSQLPLRLTQTQPAASTGSLQRPSLDRNVYSTNASRQNAATEPIPTFTPVIARGDCLDPMRVSSYANSFAQHVQDGTYAPYPIQQEVTSRDTALGSSDDGKEEKPSDPSGGAGTKQARRPLACCLPTPVAIIVGLFSVYLLISPIMYYASIQEDHDRIGVVTFLPTDSDVGVYVDEVITIDETLRRLGMLAHSRSESDAVALAAKRIKALDSQQQQQQQQQQQPQSESELDKSSNGGLYLQDTDSRYAHDLALYDISGNYLYSPELVEGLERLQNRHKGHGTSGLPILGSEVAVNGLKAAKQSRSPTEVLSYLLELAPPVAPPMLDLCGAVPQFNPVKNKFNIKSMCWDNIYYNAVLKLLSPRAWNTTVESHMRIGHATPSKAQAHAYKERTKVDEAFSRMRDSQKARLLDMHRDCLCSDQIGFPGAFAVVCDVDPDNSGNAVHRIEPSCRVFFYPSLNMPTPEERYSPKRNFQVVSSSVVYLADHVAIDAQGRPIVPTSASGSAVDLDDMEAFYAESRTLTRQDAIQREFQRRLGIQDNGHLMHNETIAISYYELPDKRHMDFFYSPVIRDAITGYHLMATQRSKPAPYFADAFAKDPLKAVWDAFRDEYIGADALAHETLKRVTLARENENANIAVMGRKRLKHMDVIRSKKQENFVENAARQIGLLRQEKNCSEFIDKYVYVHYISDQVYDKSSGMTPACLQTLHSQPRLVRRSERVTGHTAHCVMQCIRQNDILRLKKIEYDYHQPIRALFSDELFESALQKLRSDDAYGGIAFP